MGEYAKMYTSSINSVRFFTLYRIA